MLHPHLIKTELHSYHITARCFNKEFFPLGLKETWKITLEELKHQEVKNFLAIHAFVLMGNHFHLLCHTPKGNIDDCIRSFMDSLSHKLRKNPLWDEGYRLSLINSQRHYYQVYRYIYQNPLRAGLVKRVEDYPYTTLAKGLRIALHSHVPIAFGGEKGELLWLNERYGAEDIQLIRSELEHSQYDLKQNLKAVNKIILPTDPTLFEA